MCRLGDAARANIKRRLSKFPTNEPVGRSPTLHLRACRRFLQGGVSSGFRSVTLANRGEHRLREEPDRSDQIANHLSVTRLDAHGHRAWPRGRGADFCSLHDLRATVDTNPDKARRLLARGVERIVLRRQGPRLIADVFGSLAGVLQIGETIGEGMVDDVGAGRGILAFPKDPVAIGMVA